MESPMQKIWAAVGFSTFIYFFLLIFQPFQISDVKMSIPLYLSGFFVITFFVVLFSAFLLPVFFPGFFDVEKWNVKRSIFFNTLIMFLIGLLNWVYNHSLGSELVVDHSLISFLFITVAVGVFPSAFFILLVERYLSDKHRTIAQTIENNLKEPLVNHFSGSITITSDSEKDKIVLNPSDLVCAKSEGNYIKVYYYDTDRNVKNRLMRNTLTNLTDLLGDNDSFKRVHRSYFVNLSRVDQVSGNARNYNLHFKDLDFTVPLSRSFSIDGIGKLTEA